MLHLQYIEKDGRMKPKRDTAEFRGTTTYASINTQNLCDQSPRDDLWSLLYVLLDLLCGKLPWSEAAKNKDKAAVLNMKNEYNNELSKWHTWIMDCYAEYERKVL